MEKIITMETLRSFAYCNNHICKQPIRGLVLSFTGLGGAAMFHDDTDEGRFYAENGILYLFPYYNPWSWMNRQTVDFTDELVDILFEAYPLPADLPIVSTGLSMGGLSALVYTRYAKRTPTACVANCPVCDLPFHYGERPDLPRTLYSAFAAYEGTMEEAMRATSPLHLVEEMPTKTVYSIFHCEADTLVSKTKHSDPFVAAMKPGHNVAYYTIPDCGHCALPEEERTRFTNCVLQAVEAGGY